MIITGSWQRFNLDTLDSFTAYEQYSSVFFIFALCIFYCPHLPGLAFIFRYWSPLLMLSLLLSFAFQEPQPTSKERQKSIMLGSAPSNQAA